ncbi:branched-chain amino acid ABC transporter permease [Youngiibacter multivorans]|uniref:Branched-chain amino acid transport system permease protein n=1 Tax=Youngiibacter multivorans TaxID=937251 RepID=A0ABS4G1Q5_9CLOT|nr:branched-chain amino acid ABC transporter permease [Youngiibacter multivorans]MBP1918465.1 branched-chain amino acid transport system permease protein [Youngiibacter multivorans]
MQFFQQLINGLSIGSIYALLALGYTMVYGIIGLINFAHGDIYMVGAMAGFYASKAYNLPFFPTLAIAMLASGALGVLIERVAYRPLRKSPRITLLISAIGVSLLLENGMRYIVGPSPKSFPELIPVHKYDLGLFQVTNIQLLTFGISILLVILLQYIVFRTKMGKAMRAVSYDMEAAQLMGISVNKTISFTFFLGSILAGAAGIMVALSWTSIDPYMGMMPGLKAFVSAVLGGIGIIPGALIGGVFIGIAETLTKAYISTSLSDAIAFSILIIVLLVKPTGILGKVESEKV